MSKVIIAAAKRTPIGSFQGQFADVPADELGAAAIAGAVEQAGQERVVKPGVALEFGSPWQIENMHVRLIGRNRRLAWRSRSRSAS